MMARALLVVVLEEVMRDWKGYSKEIFWVSL